MKRLYKNVIIAFDLWTHESDKITESVLTVLYKAREKKHLH